MKHVSSLLNSITNGVTLFFTIIFSTFFIRAVQAYLGGDKGALAGNGIVFLLLGSLLAIFGLANFILSFFGYIKSRTKYLLVLALIATVLLILTVGSLVAILIILEK